MRYCDFRDPLQYEAKLRQLLAFLRDERLPRGEQGDHKGSPLRNLEIPRPPLVGFVARRDKDGHNLVEYVSELLAKDNAFIALWGAGGIGKTALAAEIARHHLPSPERSKIPEAERKGRGAGGEVVWASADGRADFSLGALLDAAATQLGQPDLRTLAPDAKAEAVRNLLAGLGDHVGDHKGSPLLVMDNFETVAEAEQARIAEFLASAPCAALVTSRQITPRARNIEIDAMGASEAREFVDKLIEVSPRREVFQGLDTKQIIMTAEANPLVMEWVVAQIAQEAREPRRVFDELAHGKGDAAQRVFDRSFNLPYVGEDGRAALLALTLFVPNGSRDALENVADLYPLQTKDVVGRLVSLQLAETTALNNRVVVAGLTRSLAKAHRENDKRRRKWGRRFVRYFVRFTESHEKTAPTPEDLDVLETERENLLAAMDIAYAGQDWQNVIRIADAIAKPTVSLLSLRGYWDEAIARGEQAAEAARRAGDKSAVARLSGNAASMYYLRGEYDKARDAHMLALEVFKNLGDEWNVATALHQLGLIAQAQGDYKTARAQYVKSLELSEKLGILTLVAGTIGQLSNLSMAEGDYTQAEADYNHVLEFFRKLGDQRAIAGALHQLGVIAQHQGGYETARARYAESLEITRKLGNQDGIANTLHQLGMLAEIDGDKAEAACLFRESLEIFERLKSPDAKIARESLARVEGGQRTNKD